MLAATPEYWPAGRVQQAGVRTRHSGAANTACRLPLAVQTAAPFAQPRPTHSWPQSQAKPFTPQPPTRTHTHFSGHVPRPARRVLPPEHAPGLVVIHTNEQGRKAPPDTIQGRVWHPSRSVQGPGCPWSAPRGAVQPGIQARGPSCIAHIHLGQRTSRQAAGPNPAGVRASARLGAGRRPGLSPQYQGARPSRPSQRGKVRLRHPLPTHSGQARNTHIVTPSGCSRPCFDPRQANASLDPHHATAPRPSTRLLGRPGLQGWRLLTPRQSLVTMLPVPLGTRQASPRRWRKAQHSSRGVPTRGAATLHCCFPRRNPRSTGPNRSSPPRLPCHQGLLGMAAASHGRLLQPGAFQRRRSGMPGLEGERAQQGPFPPPEFWHAQAPNHRRCRPAPKRPQPGAHPPPSPHGRPAHAVALRDLRRPGSQDRDLTPKEFNPDPHPVGHKKRRQQPCKPAGSRRAPARHPSAPANQRSAPSRQARGGAGRRAGGKREKGPSRFPLSAHPPPHPPRVSRTPTPGSGPF